MSYLPLLVVAVELLLFAAYVVLSVLVLRSYRTPRLRALRSQRMAAMVFVAASMAALTWTLYGFGLIWPLSGAIWSATTLVTAVIWGQRKRIDRIEQANAERELRGGIQTREDML